MSFRSRSLAELSRLGLPAPGAPLPTITEADLAPLPEPAQRYLRFMGVVGRPRDGSFRLGLTGRFKVGWKSPWRPCEVWQYDTSPEITRTFLMRMSFAGLPIIGRDTYRDGHGRMRGKLLGLVTVIDGSGPEFDISELVTYLNDLVLLAPSMLLVPAVTFAPVDGRSFDLALTDHGHAVKARVFLDERAAPVDFETTDRFCDDPADRKRLVRTRWTTPIAGFQDVDGRKLPTAGQAVWHPADRDFPYIEFAISAGAVAYNVPPGA